MGCDGNCGRCGGCRGSLTLTPGELEILELLGQVAFLPVGRTMGQPEPVLPEEPESRVSLALLEKKGLIEADFSAPLGGFAPPAGTALTIWGSIGLTARGQQVLELIAIQGVEG